MATSDSSTSTGPEPGPQYRAAREAFDGLDPRDKAAFLLESAFGAAGEMVAEAARAVADVMDRAAAADFWTTPPGEATTDDGPTAEPDATSAGPTPHEPPRPKRRAPAPGAADAGSPVNPMADASGPLSDSPPPTPSPGTPSSPSAPSPGTPSNDPLL